MNIVVLDEVKSRREKLATLLTDKGNVVNAVYISNDFMGAFAEQCPDKIFIDVESWFHGKGIYTYFEFEKRIDSIPIVFYNTPENFSGFSERKNSEDDKIFTKDISVADMVEEFL